LQTLVENAIKHNEFSDANPLNISVSISSDYVIVRNAMYRVNEPQPSSKIGLRNLDNRYKLITKRNIIIENNFENFIVKLPNIRF
jgi:LytS/YehU family sensor histidine kinase